MTVTATYQYDPLTAAPRWRVHCTTCGTAPARYRTQEAAEQAANHHATTHHQEANQ